MSEYPKFLCKPGTTESAHGVMIDHTTAVNRDDEKTKRGQGWFLSVADFDAEDQAEEPPVPFLDRNASDILPELKDASDKDLQDYLRAETSNKARSGVMNAISKELAAR